MVTGLVEALKPCLAEAVLGAGVLLLVVSSRLRFLEQRAGDLALLVVAASCVGAVASMDAVPDHVVGHGIVTDPFAGFFKVALSMSALAVCWLATRGRPGSEGPGGLSWACFLAALMTADVAVASTAALPLVVALAATNGATALWIATRRDHVRSGEHALALLWQGSAATSVALFGFAMLFALGGTLDYASLGAKLPLALAAPGAKAVLAAALVFVIAGLSFPTAILPWTSWRIGVAAAAPLPVVVWLQTGPTLVALAVLARLLRQAASVMLVDGSWGALASSPWPSILGLAAGLTIPVASVAALRETDLRRMLAWWSVAQSGYLVSGLAVPGDAALEAMLFHAVASSLAIAGASATLAPVVELAGSTDVEAVRGLARRRGAKPGAFALVLFFLSLAGLPPLAGYEGRAELLASAFGGGLAFLGLAASAGSAIGLLAALRVVAIVLDRPVDREEKVPVDFEVALLAGLLLLATLAFGVAPGALAALAGRSVVFFGG